MNRRHLIFSVMTATAILAATGIQGGWTQQANPAHQPFTATLREFDRTLDGFQPPDKILTIAVREDGSRVDIRKLAGKNGAESKVIVDLASRTRVSVDGLTKSRTTYQMNELWLARYSRRPEIQQTTDGTESRICGIRVVHVPKRQLVDSTWIEEWLAPEVDYFPLRSVIDHAEGQKTREVTAISLGAPDARLFQVPADYVERSPSEVFIELKRIGGGRLPADYGGPAAATLEEAYRPPQKKP